MSLSSRPRTDAAARGRVLVGGVGYRNLSDLSAGPLLADALGDLGPGVEVEDLSYGPIDVLFALQARAPYDALIIIAAAERGAEPGTVRVTEWVSPPIDPGDLQARIAEAVTGVISHENLLHILAYFRALPERTVVVEIEPEVTTYGDRPSPRVERALTHAAELIRDELALAS